MANPNRKLVTIKPIDEIIPHNNADRLEIARVGWWRCVVGKGEFHAGQLVLYFEPDSFCPVSDHRFAFLRDRGTKVMQVGGKEVEGHVLRTIRLRGEISQGLILDAASTLNTSPETVAELCAAKQNMSKALGVVEYEPMQNATAGSEFCGRYNESLAPRTDAERVQNVDQQTYDAVKHTHYEVTTKVDGTSITICKPSPEDELAIFSHNNRFKIPAEKGIGRTAYDAADRQGIIAFCEANPGYTVQAELCGPKVNGNNLRLKDYRLFVFSVYDMAERRYMSFAELDGMEGAEKVLDSYVPIISTGVLLDALDTPDDLLEYANNMRGHVTKDVLDEGLVVHIYDRGIATDEEWRLIEMALAPTYQIKAVSNRFLLKAKE